MKRLLTAIWIAIASVLFPGCGEKGPETPQGEAAVVTLPATDLSTHGAVLHARYSGASTLVAPQNVIFRYGKSSDNLDGTVSAEELVETDEKRIENSEYGVLRLFDCELSELRTLRDKLGWEHDTFFHFGWVFGVFQITCGSGLISVISPQRSRRSPPEQSRSS